MPAGSPSTLTPRSRSQKSRSGYTSRVTAYHVVLLLDDEPSQVDPGWTYTGHSAPAEGDEIEVTKAHGRARARVAGRLDGLKFSAIELERLA